MEKEQFSEKTQLLLEYSEVLAFIEQVKEDAYDEFHEKLADALGAVVERVRSANHHARTDFEAEEGWTDCIFWPSKAWQENDEEGQNRVVVQLDLGIMPGDESRLGITVQGRKDVIEALKKEYKAEADWIRDLEPQHGTRKSWQYEYQFDWFQDYADFTELATRLGDDVASLLAGMKTALANRKVKTAK